MWKRIALLVEPGYSHFRMHVWIVAGKLCTANVLLQVFAIKSSSTVYPEDETS